MFKTIFRKQFITFIGTLFITFCILGAALLGMVTNYFYDQKERNMRLQASRIAEGYINSEVVRRFPFDFYRNTSLRDQISILYSYLNASSFVCIFREDVNNPGEAKLVWYIGSINFRHWEGDEARINAAINAEETFRRARVGEPVTVIGTMSGVFPERMMIVGYPILHGGHNHGVVFMNSPTSEIEENIRDVARLMFFCLILAAFISFILVYFSSRTISGPIKMVSDVSGVIAGGDFSKRLPVKGRDEISRLATSFNFMAESLENQEMSRRSFISNISHDLRTPLTSIRGYISAILDGTIPDGSREKYLKVVLDETERVTKMANDLMYISRFQSFGPELSLTNFDINELLRQTLISFERRIQSKNLSVQVSFADEVNIVTADDEKTRRIVYNLIDNAIKYNTESGEIGIKTLFNPQKPGKITISIRDSGIGIAEGEQKKIFERFYKTDQSRGQDKSGSGLGLSIVSEFLKAQNESITLVSKPGEGSEFSFDLRVGK